MSLYWLVAGSGRLKEALLNHQTVVASLADSDVPRAFDEWSTWRWGLSRFLRRFIGPFWGKEAAVVTWWYRLMALGCRFLFMKIQKCGGGMTNWTDKDFASVDTSGAKALKSQFIRAVWLFHSFEWTDCGSQVSSTSAVKRAWKCRLGQRSNCLPSWTTQSSWFYFHFCDWRTSQQTHTIAACTPACDQRSSYPTSLFSTQHLQSATTEDTHSAFLLYSFPWSLCFATW